MNIWEVQNHLTRQLFAWAGASLATGALLSSLRDRFWKGVGAQFMGWGAINALIATLGSRISRKRQAGLAPGEIPVAEAREGRNLERLLRINTFLDILYVAFGFLLIFRRRGEDRFWRGSGWGVVIQGAFLFFFDLIHALRLRRI